MVFLSDRRLLPPQRNHKLLIPLLNNLSLPPQHTYPLSLLLRLPNNRQLHQPLPIPPLHLHPPLLPLPHNILRPSINPFPSIICPAWRHELFDQLIQRDTSYYGWLVPYRLEAERFGYWFCPNGRDEVHVCGTVFGEMDFVEAGTGQAEAGVGNGVLSVFNHYEDDFGWEEIDC